MVRRLAGFLIRNLGSQLSNLILSFLSRVIVLGSFFLQNLKPFPYFLIMLFLSDSGFFSSFSLQSIHLEIMLLHLCGMLSCDRRSVLSSMIFRFLSLALDLGELLCGQSGMLLHLPIVMVLRKLGFFCILRLQSLHLKLQ